MKPANSDATGTIKATLNTQSGNHHDARQDPDAGGCQSTQQPAPTVSVDNDRQTIALPVQFPPPQHELTNQFVPGAPPGQLSSSQPVLRGPVESVESAHGSGIGQTHVPGSLALQAPGLRSCEPAVMITGGSSLEQRSDPEMVQAALDKNYRNELSAWVESAAPAARAAHQEAQKRINAYLTNPAKRKKSLNLSSLYLKSLPPLPSDLERIDLDSNNLTALPKHLPQNLRVLRVGGNKLTALPEHLPQGLQQLDVEGNKLTALPEHLPQGLWELRAGFNKLTALPEKLPQGLLKLHAGNNKLTALPEKLPKGLLELHVFSNKLTALPAHLPEGLQELDVRGNKLSALPEYLPQGLLGLRVASNKLTALPAHLPESLQALDVSGNKLSALPEYLPQNLKYLSLAGNGFNSKTLVALMRSNASITELLFDPKDIDADSRRVIDAELVNNMEYPARLQKAAVTLDLLTRFSLATSDQSGVLMKRDSTPSSIANQLPGQPIPAELHDVLAANCPKDLLAVLVGMVDKVGNEPFLQKGS